jgi:hypothetical protein
MAAEIDALRQIIGVPLALLGRGLILPIALPL